MPAYYVHFAGILGRPAQRPWWRWGGEPRFYYPLCILMDIFVLFICFFLSHCLC